MVLIASFPVFPLHSAKNEREKCVLSHSFTHLFTGNEANYPLVALAEEVTEREAEQGGDGEAAEREGTQWFINLCRNQRFSASYIVLN